MDRSRQVRPFEYSMLTQAREIRLLSISKETETGRMLCKFIPTLLENSVPEFTAISYCWGSATIQEKVWFDDQQFLAVN
jgi:hypothetical protein